MGFCATSEFPGLNKKPFYQKQQQEERLQRLKVECRHKIERMEKSLKDSKCEFESIEHSLKADLEESRKELRKASRTQDLLAKKLDLAEKKVAAKRAVEFNIIKKQRELVEKDFRKRLADMVGQSNENKRQWEADLVATREKLRVTSSNKDLLQEKLDVAKKQLEDQEKQQSKFLEELDKLEKKLQYSEQERLRLAHEVELFFLVY